MVMPAYEPNEKDRQLVLELARDGVNQKDIAFIIGTTDKTLRKYYGDDMRRVRIDCVRKAGKTLYEQGLGGNMAALIFYLKSQGGWREKQDVEVNVSGGVTLEHSVSEEVLERLIEKL